MRGLSLLVLAGCHRLLGLEPLPDVPPGGSGDLVAHFPLEIVDEQHVEDVTGHSHVLICSGSDCPTSSPGKIDGALHFDGDDILTGPSRPDLESGPFTVTLWARIETLPGMSDLDCLASKVYGPTSSNSWQLCFDELGILHFLTSSIRVRSPAPVQLAVWHHYAMRWDGSEITLTVDGVDVVQTFAGVGFDAGKIVLGGDLDNSAPLVMFIGSLDDVRIYNRALATSEIAALANP